MGKGVYAPSYYADFKCIADKCRHSCCIDWEICIDEETYEKYKTLEDVIGRRESASSNYSLLPTVIECDGEAAFAMSEDGRCPHLNESGLCNIIISHGEEYLSQICREHPRFYNDLGRGRTEAGLGIACEEACRLVLECERAFSLYKISDAQKFSELTSSERFDAIDERDRIISLIESDSGLDETVLSLKEELGILEPYSPAEWINRFLFLEILDEEWERELLALRDAAPRAWKRGRSENERFYKRLLIYFIYRHLSTSESAIQLRARLGFAILSLDMIRLLFESGKNLSSRESCGAPPGLIDIARRYSAEIEYSEDNTDELFFAFEGMLLISERESSEQNKNI